MLYHRTYYYNLMACYLSQGPGHCHVEIIKDWWDNKDVFLTILRWHVCEGQIQYLCNLQVCNITRYIIICYSMCYIILYAVLYLYLCRSMHAVFHATLCCIQHAVFHDTLYTK